MMGTCDAGKLSHYRSCKDDLWGASEVRRRLPPLEQEHTALLHPRDGTSKKVPSSPIHSLSAEQFGKLKVFLRAHFKHKVS